MGKTTGGVIEVEGFALLKILIRFKASQAEQDTTRFKMSSQDSDVTKSLANE